jgi:hypothetical protein
VLDPNFFRRKARTLLQLADAIDDPIIARRMRDLASECRRQAEFLTDDEKPPDTIAAEVQRRH